MTKLIIKKDFVIDKIDGEITIFNTDSSIFYSFNKSASYIFEMIKKGFDEKRMISSMTRKFKIPEIQAKKDISVFLKKLSKNKIISSS